MKQISNLSLLACKSAILWAAISGYAHAGDSCPGGNCPPVEVQGYPLTDAWTLTSFDFTHGNYHNEMDGGGGGGMEVANPGNPDGKKNPKKDPCNKSGNPIIYSTGNKIEPETDFESRGITDLSLHRTYNNYWDGIGIFGKNWVSDYDYKLAFNTSSAVGTCYPKPGATCATPPTNITTFWAMRPDGRQIKYIYNATQGVWWEDKASPISKIVRNADGTYTLYGESHNVERYSATGYVQSIANEQGVGWSFTYDASNYLQRVTHTSGRYVRFTWNGNQLTRVTDPQGNQFNYTYLANRDGAGSNLLLTATLPGTAPTTVTYYYEDGRFPFGLTGKDYNGTRYSTFAYDAAGRATLSQHGSGLQTMDKYTFSYTDPGDGTFTAVETNPLSRQTTYHFANGNITSTSGTGGANCMGTSKSHTYDANGYDDQVTDFDGNVTKYTYSANGQLQQQVEAYGSAAPRTSTYQWDPDPTRNRLVSITVVGVRQITYTYDTLGRLATVTTKNISPYGVANQTRTITYSYTAYSNGMTKSVTVDGPLPGTADAVVSNYSSSGDLTSQINGLGHAVTYSAYNGLGEVGHVVDANGTVADFTYDAQGRLINLRTYPNGTAADTVYSYDSSGLLTAVTTPDGVTQNYSYDVTRHLSAVWSGSGAFQQEEDNTYDPMGNITTVQDRNLVGHYHDQCTKWWTDGEGYNECIESVQVWVPAGTVTRSSFTTYDGLGRVSTVPGNNGQNFRTTYDADGNPSTITDSLNHGTTLTYDGYNRVAKVVNAKNGISQFSYDLGGNLTKFIDPKSLVTTYVYDGFGQLWSETSPDTGTVSFTYDAFGQRTSMSRADGSVTTYAYDSAARLTSVTAGGKTQTFVYDTCVNGKGRLCSATDAQGSLSSTYTPQGWIASQTSVIAGVSYTTSFAYDSLGRRTSVTYPDGAVAHYTYANGRLSAMTVTVNGVTSNVVTGLAYQPFGGATGWTYGNGLVRGNNFDLDGRLTGISSTVPSNSAVIQGLTFGYDANNSINSVANSVIASLTQNFTFDELARLSAVTSGSGNWSWGYDQNSNRTSQLSPSGNSTYTSAATSNWLSALSGTGARTFGYDVLGNRITDTSTATLGLHYDSFNRMDSSTWNGVTTSYHVNAIGQRNYKWTNGSNWTHFVFAPGGRLLAEKSSAGMTDYLWAGTTPVGMIRNNSLYAIHTDHLDRPEMVTSPTQVIVWRASNFAFHRSVSQDNIGGLNLGFPGQYYDSETGLWNNGFRDYDASVGRYVESDPIGLGGGINTYAYVGADPVNNTDSSGLITDCEMKALREMVNKYGYGPQVNADNFKEDPNMTGHSGQTGRDGISYIGTNPAAGWDQYSGSVVDRNKVGDLLRTGWHENVHQGELQQEPAYTRDWFSEKFTGYSHAEELAEKIEDANPGAVDEFKEKVKDCNCKK